MKKMRKFALKIINLRKSMIKIGKSYKNEALCLDIIAKFENWLRFYPNTPDENVKRYIIRHESDFVYLFPGGDSPVSNHIKQEYVELIKHTEYFDKLISEKIESEILQSAVGNVC